MSNIATDIVNQFKKGHTSVSFLLSGPKGTGKKKIVEQVAEELLGKNSATLMSGLKWVECGLTDEAKKALQKSVSAGESLPLMEELDHKNEITMEEMRQGLDFLSLKSTLPCKILAISLAEEMNENVQNALLKTLEEPFEKTLIFLLSENPQHLLPTILSRCQRIVLHSLTNKELREKIIREFPEISDIDRIVSLSDGMPGIATLMCEKNGVGLYQKLSEFLCPLAHLDFEKLISFISEHTKDKDEFLLLRHFILKFIYDCSKEKDLEKSYQFSLLYQEVENRLSLINFLYLDKVQVLENIILKIAEILS